MTQPQDKQPPTDGLGEVARAIGGLPAHFQRRAAAAEAQRDATLASDADRDHATQLIAQAYATGRISAEEHDQRAGHALRARTIGELDDVLHGLGGFVRPVTAHAFRKVLFWLVAVPTMPLLLVGVLFVLGGSDLGDRVFGIILLLVLGPGLLALGRSAWPRR